jgi:hypothetical protein
VHRQCHIPAAHDAGWDSINVSLDCPSGRADLDSAPPLLGISVAIFRQINKEQPRTHHDALEFPNGSVVLLTMLCDGQEATVLQVPAQPTTAAEEEVQKRVVYVG